MDKPITNSIEEINRTRVLKIKWPDKTCTFVNEEYAEGILTIKYNFKDFLGRVLEPYENSFKLDAFDTKIGVVKKVVFLRVPSLSENKVS